MGSSQENITLNASIEPSSFSQSSTIAAVLPADSTERSEVGSDEVQREAVEADNAELPLNQNLATASDTNNEAANEAEHDERPSKKVKLNETIEEDGAICVICYEVWNQSGDHRISALKCGHCFGHKCILRWLTQNKVCPTCKAKAIKKDIRFIYASKLIAKDTAELTRLQDELEGIKTENINLQIELTSVLCKLAMVNVEVEKYKLQIEKFRCIPSAVQETKHIEQTFNLKQLNSYVICPHGSCRVMDFILSKASVVASMKSGTTLFSGFGVKHFNSETFQQLAYIPLHNKAIRDLQFNQLNAQLLSVSLDKHFSIANIYSNETNIKQTCDDMLWACCWDATHPNIFYVGGQQGSVKVFDSRYITDNPVHTLSIDGDRSPVVAINSIPSGAGNTMPQGGFVACKLNSLWAFEKSSGIYKPHLLPIEGPFVSTTYNEDDKQLLVSARPNAREPTARHIVCNLSNDADGLGCNRVHTFSGGRMQKQLARSCFLEKNNLSYVATPNDITVQLWNSQTGFPVTVGRTTGPIIDLLPISNNDGMHLLALTEKRLSVFKVVD